MANNKYLSKIVLVFIVLTICVNISILQSLDSTFLKSKQLNSQIKQKQEAINEPFFATNSVVEIESFFENAFWIQEDLIGSAISSPTLSDLDGDGDMEIIILTTNSIIYILDHEGNFLEGWGTQGIVGTDEGVELTSNLGVSPYPIALDLNGDGEKEIICATYDPGTLLAWFLNATAVPNWDIELSSKITSSLSAGDIDGDGEKEIVVGTWDNNIHAFELNGSEVDGFPYTGATDLIIGTPALANLDGDAALEIVFGSYDNAVHAIDGNGVPLPGWPQNTTYHIRASPAVTDLNNDSKNEIIIGSWDRNLYIYHQNGSLFGEWPWEAENAILNSATIGDLNMDGINDFVIQPTNVTLFAFTDAKNGKNIYWNNTQSEIIYEDAIICDINGDFIPEIIEVTPSGKILILSNNGTELFKEELSAKGIDSAPVIGDIDEDGLIEIIITTHGTGIERDFSDVYCYKLGSFGLLPWPSYRGGNERIGITADTDQDGLSDLEEEIVGSNPLVKDTDGDGLLDGDEINKYRLDPTTNDADHDTDGDLLTNVDEVDIYFTNPTIKDTDGDTLEDGYEVLISGTNPINSDTDGDFLPDGFEVQYENPNPFVPDTYEDLDEDDLTNIEEYTHNTNPDIPDTDGDGLLDGDEVKRYLTDPLVQDADLDSDGDGISNVDEIDIYGTNPINDDTDGDGITDDEEIRRGSDPNDPNSKPFPLWALAPIIGGSILILTISGYFVGKNIYKKRRGFV